MTALLTATGLFIPGRLQQTDLTVESGQLVGLVGPNGSGKTSLLHAIAGIGSAAGEVRIDGQDPKRLAPAQRQRLLSYLPASREVKWPVSSSDLIRLGLPPNSDAAVAAAMEQLGIDALAQRRVDQLSTGERSRVLIARALAPRPKLLLLDEPVSNLDPYWQLRLMEQLVGCARDNDQALLVAVHDLDLAARFADRLIVMDRGAIAADGHPHSLVEGPEVAGIFGIERSGGVWRPSA